uniref:Uncharacterized protein n=1 Tax=Rhodnius prolixus TaxID=13249 RepID=T1HLV1_RHOPR
MTHWLYTRTLIPIITYGEVVWWRKTEQQAIKALARVQKLVCPFDYGGLEQCPYSLGITMGAVRTAPRD